MKFTDGYWLIKTGIEANFAVQALETEADDESLTVIRAGKADPVARRHRQRDDTHGPVFEPDEKRNPGTTLALRRRERTESVFCAFKRPGISRPSIEESPESAILKAGDLSVRIEKGDAWNIAFLAGGKTLTKNETKSAGYMIDERLGPFMKDELALGVGECVYGLGERFTAFVKNGQSVDMWNADGGTASEQTYKNIPFYLTNRGYGIFVNDTGKVSFEVASEKVSRVPVQRHRRIARVFRHLWPDTERNSRALYSAHTAGPPSRRNGPLASGSRRRLPRTTTRRRS